MYKFTASKVSKTTLKKVHTLIDFATSISLTYFYDRKSIHINFKTNKQTNNEPSQHIKSSCISYITQHHDSHVKTNYGLLCYTYTHKHKIYISLTLPLTSSSLKTSWKQDLTAASFGKIIFFWSRQHRSYNFTKERKQLKIMSKIKNLQVCSEN